MHYLKKSGELIYRKNTKAKPYFVYIILSIINKIPFYRMPHFFSALINGFFKILRLKVTFMILNKKLQFYIYSGMRDFAYYGGMPHEARVSEAFLCLAPSDSVLYDIGSAAGWYSILLAGKCKHIIGFDPYDTSSLINIKLNKIENFELFPYFVSDKEEMPVISIDGFIAKHPKPNILKIDVEGEEYKVLLGAKNTFSIHPPQLVFIETHSEQLFYQCVEFLKQFHYKIHHLGCPKINVGGDIYSLSYDLNTNAYTTKSVTRVIIAIKK